MRYDITLKDTQTDEVITFEWIDPIGPRSTDISEDDDQVRYYWEEGHRSCDCTRASWFGHEDRSCNKERYNLQKIINLVTGKEVNLLFPESCEVIDILKESRRDGDTLYLDLWYPKCEGNIKFLQLGLVDVRAGEDIRISYDFDRNGWKIELPTVHVFEMDDKVCDRKWTESAFIQTPDD